MPANWRIMGRWRSGRQFLIVMGDSRTDCKAKLREALRCYTSDDLSRIDNAWLEWFCEYGWPNVARWEPTEEVSLQRVRLERKQQRKYRRKIHVGETTVRNVGSRRGDGA